MTLRHSLSPDTSGSAADQEFDLLEEFVANAGGNRIRRYKALAALVGVREQLRQAEQEIGARQKPREEGEGEGLDRASDRQVARAAIRVVLRHLGTEGEREVEAEIAKVVQQEANRG